MKIVAHRGVSAVAPENTMSAFRLAIEAGADAGERVPTLEEVLSLENVEFELELKGYGADFLEGVIRAVGTARALDRVEFTGWNLPLLAMLKRGTPSARVGLFSSRRPSWMPDSVFEHHVVGTAATSGADVAHVYAGDLTPSISRRLHDLGLEVHANDAATTEDVRRAVRADADRVSANDVDLAFHTVRHPT